MKKLIVSLICSFLVILGFGSSLAPTVEAAPVKVVTKYYKHHQNLPYPYLHSGYTALVRGKVNHTIAGHMYLAYLKEQRIEAQERRDKQTRWCKDHPSFCNYSFNTAYKIKNTHSKYFIVQMYDFAYTGGAHGNGVTKLYNFNVRTVNNVPMTHVLATKSKIHKVHHYAYNYMKDRDRFNIDHPSDFKINKNTQFYFVHGGIRLVFQEYEVGPYALGFQEVFIPAWVYR